MSAPLAGTAPLLHATARAERKNFAPWIAITTALAASSVLVYPWVFPEVAEREALATAVTANPALGLIFGPARDLLTADGFGAWRGLALGGFLAALGAILAVTRTTRAQEDSGQAELLASGVLGRGARLLAGAGFALAGSVLLGAVAGLITVACGGAWNASLLLGATFTGTAWMFAGIAAVTAQLASDARTANSLAVGALGTLFVLRGFAYSMSAPTWTIWANPLGWMSQTQPATKNDWVPLAYAAAFTAVALAVAFALQARRDFGQGAIASRPGPARGATRSAGALALRLNRGTLITWAVAFAGIGVIFGYLAVSVPGILTADTAVAGFLAAGAATPDQLVSAFLVTILSLVGIIAAVPGVQVMVKLRAEELEDRIEPLLATQTRRPRLYAGSVLLALTAPAVYVLTAGTVIAALASAADFGVTFGDAFGQTAATVPATWTAAAVSVAVIGARPHVSIAAWAGVLISFVLTLLGPIFKLWDWVLGISPFWHVANVTAANANWWGLVWISLATAFFLAVGFAGFRRRDVGY